MSAEWKVFTVANLVEQGIIEKPLDGNHGGIHPKGDDFVETGIPFIMASDIENGHINYSTCKYISPKQANGLRKGFAKTGDVLLTHKATIGRTAIVGALKTPYIVLTPQVTYYRIVDHSKLDNQYLKYYFDSNEFQQIFSLWAGGGSTRDYLGITEQQRLPILLPTLETQRRIAEVLSAFDDKIELNRQMIQTLEAMAQAIFKSWFVDFEPFQDGEFIDSELGKIPISWRIESLDDIATFLNGLAMQKYPVEKDTDQYLPVIKISQLKQGNTLGADKASLRVPSEYVINDGNIIFSWSGSLEIDIWCGGIGALNQHLFKVSSKKYPKWFFYFWSKWHLENFRKIAADKAVTMGHIKREHLSGAKCVCPENFEAISTIDIQMTSIVEKIIQLKCENKLLLQSQKITLPKIIDSSEACL